MTRTVLRTCPLCEATCGLSITMDGARPVRVRGNADDVFSQGYICPKGASLANFDTDPDRLARPLLRQPDGSHAEISWPEAFAELERGLRSVMDAHGRESVALYTGNPVIHTIAIPLYLTALRTAFNTRHIYSTTTLDTMPRMVACGLLYGDPLSMPLPDIDNTDHLFVLGSNLLETNGSLWTVPRLPARLTELRKRGGKFVVVDPRRTRTAERADDYVPIRPGADPLLLFAILHTLFAEGLDTDPGPHVVGVDDLRALAAEFAPERVAERCDIPAETIRRLARELAAAPRAAVYGRLGTSTTEFGGLTSWLVEAVNIVTGNLDVPGGVLFGQSPHATQPITEPFRIGRWHSRVRGAPETNGELPTAVLAEEIETPGTGQIRAMVVIAGNPVLAAPNGDRLDRALAGLDFLVSIDQYLNETSRHAHLVLPPPPLMQTPHYDVVLARRAIRRYARYSVAADPLPEGTPSEAEILARLAMVGAGRPVGGDHEQLDQMLIGRMLAGATARPGSPLNGRAVPELAAQLHGDNAFERRLDLMLRLGQEGDLFGSRPSGMNLQVLRDSPNGVDFGPLESQLPGVLTTASGKVELCPEPMVRDVARLVDRLDEPARDGFVLISRRRLKSVNSWSHNVSSLSGGSNAFAVELNTLDATRLGLANGDLARIRGRHGEVVAAVELTDALLPGVVSVPYGWGHGRAGSRMRLADADPGASLNSVTDDLMIDPLSGVAVFNAVPVDVAPVEGTP
ncbi:MAG: molybdopterin-dependent oxidoreductase [Actinomycetota bacterium]|nr:molybdopterin-dependent oxidoreductase [Actinomycetota bacterium]